MTAQTTTNQDEHYNQLVCAQLTAKRQLQLTTVPTSRIELQNTTYTNYTKYQLDMRQKTEILKYNSNVQRNKKKKHKKIT